MDKPTLGKAAGQDGLDQLKRQAKKLGGKIVTPEGKAKTKQQLINTIVMKQRLSGQSDRQVGKSNTAKDATKQAKTPGKRTSSTGRVYYERRAKFAAIVVLC
jgi:hypothetical protein